MKELQSLLDERETSVMVDFEHLKNRVRCYAHIINICSSHVISSMTSVSKRYLSKLKVPIESSPMIRDDSKDESDFDEVDPEYDIDELDLADCYDGCDDSNFEGWVAGIKRDPLGRARRIIRLLHSSNLRREGFRKFIQDGNE
jgi:hypothetical protein